MVDSLPAVPIECRQFGATKCAGKACEEEGFIPHPCQGGRERADHPAKIHLQPPGQR